jgi:hypothetical protein
MALWAIHWLDTLALYSASPLSTEGAQHQEQRHLPLAVGVLLDQARRRQALEQGRQHRLERRGQHHRQQRHADHAPVGPGIAEQAAIDLNG